MQLSYEDGKFPCHLPLNYKDSISTSKHNYSIESTQRFNHYLHKTYLKTGSLIAKSCAASSLLNSCSNTQVKVAYEFGRNFGISFQLIDDILDFTSSSLLLGKPVNADLKSGLTTGPVLYALEVYPELKVLVKRKFREVGDVEKVLEKVYSSGG